MIRQYISNLTPKQIITYLVIIAVAIYVVWYVVEALEGLNPNYQPFHARAGDGTEVKGGIEIFDPTKKTPEIAPTPTPSQNSKD